MKAYFSALKHYADATGRTGRQDFLVYAATLLGLLFLGAVFDGANRYATGAGPIFWIVLLFHLIPTITLVIRRLHDANTSAWWLLLFLIPYAGWFLVLMLCVLSASDPMSNKHGLPIQAEANLPQSSILDEPVVAAAGEARTEPRIESASSPVQPTPPEIDPGKSAAAPLNSSPTAESRRAKYAALRESGMLSEAEYLRLIKGLQS